ncbi:MAG: flagellar export protein FliJ [Desulfovibrio sp.]|nr:flagellar export protein FliJ [Desulfovibrio sp.]
MPFHFPMQKILDYRQQLEEEAKIQLSQAQTRVRQAEEHLEELRTLIVEAEQKAREKPALNAAEFWIAEQYMRGLKEDLSQGEMQLKMAYSLRDEAQKVLTLRAIDKNMLVKLKERQTLAWNHAEKLKEQHFNDEIATIRYQKAPAG